MRSIVIANPTIDYVITSEGVARRMGGPPYFMGMALTALGYDVEAVGVVGPEDRKFIEEELSRIGVRPKLIEGDATTVFELDYRVRPRASRALRRPTVKISGTFEAPLIIINPVYDEIGRVDFYADISAVDLQGFIRSRTEPLEADILHFSDDDVALEPRDILKFNDKWRIVLYTRGALGAYMAVNKRIFYAHSASIDVEDTTGSGDIFLAVFAAVMLRKGDPAEALCEAVRRVAGYLAFKRVEQAEFDCNISPYEL
ncbi:PfkB family carbohydrate kinase [Thermoproteus tenax]|uniref:Fructose-1-phosphate kinase n=1 Tax=Thermoproteus tenax (strain ATCC 35583 / DSM 2078 / JCM 9277 / NBRC 100435 / Kra 1) TaxID=768679 RepID=G4RMN1_THETK|nr:PfkB family carbohydrate kinase [Thermoproteus tenax]CCC82707.1 putative fructose-1-phosphate kinase [Thermoproteus tenax Kra 1]